MKRKSSSFQILKCLRKSKNCFFLTLSANNKSTFIYLVFKNVIRRKKNGQQDEVVKMKQYKVRICFVEVKINVTGDADAMQDKLQKAAGIIYLQENKHQTNVFKC